MNRRMPNGTYGGVGGRRSKIKLLLLPDGCLRYAWRGANPSTGFVSGLKTPPTNGDRRDACAPGGGGLVVFHYFIEPVEHYGVGK
jgi:hypothetical protein